MNKISLINYFFAIAIITVISGIIYATVQQVYQSGTNDPQVEFALNINLKLHKGKPVEEFFADSIDISQSLSEFNVLFDQAGKPIRSSGYLDNKMPELPEAVFDFAKESNENNITWQPRSEVRIAMVVITSKSSPVGFVASGRSLQ